MKINNLNLTLEWDTLRNIPNYIQISQEFPSYNISVKDKNNNLIEKYFDIKNNEPFLEKKSRKISRIPKIKYFVNLSKNQIKSSFKYNFENNYNKFKELNNKLGFFKELLFSID